jgi:hypothetical protein
MISHAWDEGFVDLLLALSVAPQKGPLWVREPGAVAGREVKLLSHGFIGDNLNRI